MNPLSLRLARCRTWDELELDLPEGLLALTGKNGSGKSTIVNAIEIALFGPESRTLADWYPRSGGTDPLQIELVFEHGGQTYRVRRSYSPKGRGMSKLDLDLDSGTWEPLTLESQVETQARLEALIGITRETFRASSFLAQGEAGLFCEAAPRQRKAILADALGLQEWEGWLERARAEKRQAEGEIDRLTGLVQHAEQELATRSDVRWQRDAAADEIERSAAAAEQAAVATVAAREALAEAKARADKRALAERAAEQARASYKQTEGAYLALDAEVAAINHRLEDRDSLEAAAGRLPVLRDELEREEARAREWQERQRLAVDADRLADESNALGYKAQGLEARATAVLEGMESCDRCGQALHEDAARRAAESYRAEAKARLTEAAAVDQQVVALERTLAKLPQEAPEPKKLSALTTAVLGAREAELKLAALAEAEVRREAAAEEREKMRGELPRLEASAVAARAEVERLGPHDPEILRLGSVEVERLRVAESEARSAHSGAQAGLARLDERLERLDEIDRLATQTLEQRERLLADVDVLAALEKACGQNGVPAMILETRAIPQLEMEAGRILQRLGGPAFAAKILTQREKKSGGLADTLEIQLETDDGDAPYESFSGGERARIAFALRLALAQLLATRRGADTGLLVVDEIDGLDADGVSALVGVLEELRQQVPRIVVVSHDAELRDAFPDSLALENVDGHSRISVT